MTTTMKAIYNHNCEACPLHKTAKTVCVRGRGRSDAKVMLIGEAPGAREDKWGEAFVGNSGKWLDRKLGPLLDEVWITNIVKCRPPRNRTPKGVEMDVCAELYLRQELDLLKPELIVTLGLVATSMFFPIGGFRRGDVVESPELFGQRWHVLASPHPANAMQNADDEKIFDICLLTLRQFTEGLALRGSKCSK